MDPRTYIRAGIYAGGVAAGAAIAASTMGAGVSFIAGLGAGISEGILDGVQYGALEDLDTSDFFMCGVKEKDIKHSNESGFPMHIIINGEVDEETGNITPTISFAGWRGNPPELSKRKYCDVKVAQMPCEDHIDDDTKNKNLRNVGVQVKNLNSVNITRLALVHKYQAVGPELLSYGEGLKIGEATDAQNVTTITNFSVRSLGVSDWWMMAWQDEEDACLVKSTFDLDLMRDAFKGVNHDIFERKNFFAVDAIGLGMLPPEIGAPLSFMLNHGHDLQKKRDAVVNGLASDLFGDELINTLSKSKQDKNGFFTKCNLKHEDVVRSAEGVPPTVAIDRANNTVVFNFATRECTADIIILRCVYSEECMEREDCKELAAEGMKHAPPPKNVNLGGIVGGALKGAAGVVRDVAD
jgi:hypothetical protein